MSRLRASGPWIIAAEEGDPLMDRRVIEVPGWGESDNKQTHDQRKNRQRSPAVRTRNIPLFPPAGDRPNQNAVDCIKKRQRGQNRYSELNPVESHLVMPNLMRNQQESGRDRFTGDQSVRNINTLGRTKSVGEGVLSSGLVTEFQEVRCALAEGPVLRGLLALRCPPPTEGGIERAAPGR